LLALTVDHGLRTESGVEAAQVGTWLAERGIDHQIIRWQDPKTGSGVQEAARAARYGLLLGRCREAGILHLLVGHHRDDQAETVVMRIESGTGPDGLAAMSPSVAAGPARLLRPLLDLPRARLEDTLTALGQPWLDDPSNRNRAFARVRVRVLMPDLATEGLDAAALAGAAHEMASARDRRDAATSALLARAVTLSPLGYALIDATILTAASDEIGARALGRVIRTIGGGVYPAPVQRRDRLWHAIKAGLDTRRSLGGCLIAPTKDRLLVTRELSATEAPRAVEAGQTIRWDGRFAVRVGGSGSGCVGALGRDGWLATKGKVAKPELPSAILGTLPTLFDAEGVVEIPHLGWRREASNGAMPSLRVEAMMYSPNSPLTGAFWSG
jgi:tRNA(Ile)-lysidine synthase